MEKKKAIGIAVGVVLAVVIIIGVVLLFAYKEVSRPDKYLQYYLITEPGERDYERPTGESFEITCRWITMRDNTTIIDESSDSPGFLRWIDPYGHYIQQERWNDPYTDRSSRSLKLLFKNPSSNNSGTYICDGDYQNQTKRINIKFYDTPPTFSSNYQKQVVYDTSSLFNLVCQAEGSKPITYEWYNLNSELIEDGKFEHISVSPGNDFSILHFNGGIAKGNYTCKAKNAHGEASKVFEVSHENDGSPKFERSYIEVASSIGSEVRLQCEALGELPLTYTWYDKEDRDISKGNTLYIEVETSQSSSTLFIQDAQADHSGFYTCTAENKLGRSSLIFDVKISEEAIPIFSTKYENLTVEKGSELELFCYAENDNGTFNYEWYNQHNTTLTPNQNSSVYASSTIKGSVLTIDAVDINHSGVYECRAKNQHGQASKYFGVSVDPKTESIPNFDDTYEYALAENGSKLELRCSAAGDKPMTYQWHNQFQEEIGSDEELLEYVVTTEDVSVLVIKKLKMSHKGIYTCTAKNKHGMFSKLFEISVYAANTTDENSIRHVQVRKVTSKSVLFGIAASDSVNTIEVKYTEMKEKNETIVSFKAGDVYEVTNLIQAGFYHFQFRADDESWSNDVYNVTLLPDRPEIIIRIVESDRLQIEWFNDWLAITRYTISKYEISYFLVEIERGMYWKPSSCAVNITVPSCKGSTYTITGLTRGYYNELQVRAFTESGYGEPYKHKFYLPR